MMTQQTQTTIPMTASILEEGISQNLGMQMILFYYHQPQKVLKKHLDKIPHATVVHKKKEFSSICHFPVKHLCKELRAVAATLPTSTSRTMRIKTGDQGAEKIFHIVKRNIARLNLQRSTKHASINFLSAAWLHRHVGLAGVAEGLAKYRHAMLQQTSDPQLAFKSTTWLHSLEKVE